MSNSLIICTKTGTILNLEDVVIVTETVFDDDETYSDSEICEIGKEHGITIEHLVREKEGMALARAQARMRQHVDAIAREVLED